MSNTYQLFFQVDEQLRRRKCLDQKTIDLVISRANELVTELIKVKYDPDLPAYLDSPHEVPPSTANEISKTVEQLDGLIKRLPTKVCPPAPVKLYMIGEPPGRYKPIDQERTEIGRATRPWTGVRPGGVEVSVSFGTSSTSTSFINTGNFSAGVEDAHAENRTHPSGTGFVGGAGVSATLGSFPSPYASLTPAAGGGFGIFGNGVGQGTNFGLGWFSDSSPPLRSRYAPEAKNAYAAYFPLKAAPKPQAPRWTYGVDGNVYFFAGGDQTITGIPGGPFGTATGTDNFRISNNYMFTVGGWITAPITPTWRVSLTGGLAELNQTVKYNCVTFCAIAPATPAFTASQDKWVTGGYIGGRLAMPVALPGFPGANIGIDYKHVFFGNYNVALGTIPTRQVNARLSPDMDLVTLRLAMPIR
jgi:hypothetical protein